MSGRIRVAIAGVGNCASSLVQGVEFYRNADPTEERPRPDARRARRLPRRRRRVRRRVRRRRRQGRARPRQGDLRRASTTRSSSPRSPELGVARAARPDVRRPRQVLPRDRRGVAGRAGRRRAGAARRAGRRARVSYLPVGSEEAQRYYAQACLDAGVAFVNAIPVFIASDPEWAEKFEAAGVPIVGDDIKSQVGATITHRLLARLFEDRGTRDRPHLPAQLRRQHGLQEHARARAARSRRRSRRRSRSRARSTRASSPTTCTSARPTTCRGSNDRKWAYIRLEGRNFGDVPLNIELKLEVWDSPNSAGVIIDAVRCCKVALDRGIGGPLARPVGLLHEVAAGAVPRRRSAPDGREVRGR